MIGILSEIGRIDEASAAAREALPMMRRARRYFVEEWAYLFWRRGQRESAALLLGASDAKCVRDELPLQANERRLIAAARAALEGAAAGRSRALAAGAALGEADLPAASPRRWRPRRRRIARPRRPSMPLAQSNNVALFVIDDKLTI